MKSCYKKSDLFGNLKKASMEMCYLSCDRGQKSEISNKRPQNLIGLQRQRCIPYSHYLSIMGHLWLCSLNLYAIIQTDEQAPLRGMQKGKGGPGIEYFPKIGAIPGNRETPLPLFHQPYTDQITSNNNIQLRKVKRPG